MARREFNILCVDDAIKADIPQLVSTFNRTQDAFRLIVPVGVTLTMPPPVTPGDIALLRGVLGTQLGADWETKQWVLILPYPLKNNFFSDVKGNLAVITTHDWGAYSPPSVVEYLKCEVLLSNVLLTVQRDIGHVETKGCLFDYCGQKLDIHAKLAAGHVCSICAGRLRNLGMTELEIYSCYQVLWHISELSIPLMAPSTKYSGCPIGEMPCSHIQEISQQFSEKRVFLAVSFSDEYKPLIALIRKEVEDIMGYDLMLVGHGILSRQILCEICRSIRKCKFGIAEFSSFRPNVFYELGLMQAFGLRCLAVMDAARFQAFQHDFSDFQGIGVVPYGNPAELMDRISTFVKQHG